MRINQLQQDMTICYVWELSWQAWCVQLERLLTHTSSVREAAAVQHTCGNYLNLYKGVFGYDIPRPNKQT